MTINEQRVERLLSELPADLPVAARTELPAAELGGKIYRWRALRRRWLGVGLWQHRG
jgi:hypothetical protein